MIEEKEKAEEIDWIRFKDGLNECFMQDHKEWAGPPIPIWDLPLVLEQRHPYYRDGNGLYMDSKTQELAVQELEPKGVKLINRWYCASRHRSIVIYEDLETKERKAICEDESAYERLTLHLRTIGAVQMAWEIPAEVKAMQRLMELVNLHQYKCYLMTGSFLETSPRSGVTYVFRRLRPTLALRTVEGGVTCLAGLCLHPIGYYANSFAGTMVPTDDVIAHLVMMRGDEHFFWRKSNQHRIHEARAGV